MIMLTIDTSTFALSVAVVDHDRTIGEWTTHLKKNHSIRLMPAVRMLLEECDLSLQDLDAVAVAKGPGSYTGVRIGLMTAKSLAWAAGLPLYGVSSLSVLAANARGSQLISPFMDARRGQVFTGLYRFENGKLMQEKPDQIRMHDDWLHELAAGGEPVTLISPDYSKHQELISQTLGELELPAHAQDHLPRASSIAMLAAEQNPYKNVHDAVPEYLRLAEAEAKWREAHGK
ncbi:tRNA (adenosine(37)-N6)-threonylcarbamoyltransferase complex dimerization subunit type 1 TsaB [Alkalicoccus urumqiensis]|uniref:tRNA (Adenosine(37)-N6)-threonylcarbamoyltransferase complex dimerization subunit type 1 TsaB n=1 Tax=Alkalicoccus urumqiensis TaxID=1548213 RepID=A0A2P6MJA9_ALKUR|nr:tRNA (adenosine(37)-N6)-threonylcarbamoyltransferase complex dimerization subunit type 1 TsaB [Alkalicoccus urumqiensis]PRO66367.1 tRNA (adenosine(37)-N6)-threonylcarbamoyltransferase complex dimerization subunit type 1 TsaB [Alkalicoccus urumqiensis]